MNEPCAKCKYWEASENKTKSILNVWAPKEVGVCHRYPLSNGPNKAYTITPMDYYCGEFKWRS